MSNTEPKDEAKGMDEANLRFILQVLIIVISPILWNSREPARFSESLCLP